MIRAASDGFLHLMVRNVASVLKACIICGKERTLITFIVIAILKVIVATSTKEISELGLMLVIARAMGTLTHTPAGILSRVL